MIMVANYITSLEGDRLKLKAQVKRLCAENNWLRESLTESQQLLQEAEVSMGKLKVDKEHLEFLQIQQGGPRGSLNFNSYTEEQESEMMDEKGGVFKIMISHLILVMYGLFCRYSLELPVRRKS